LYWDAQKQQGSITVTRTAAFHVMGNYVKMPLSRT
jgi:hypothetical protein